MAKALYDSVGDVARKVKKKYDGVNGVARKVKKAYDSVGGVARQYWGSGAKLGELTVGEIVYMNVNGVRREFIVVNQGVPSSAYDSSCDGTWLLMKDIYANRVWDSTNNDYANSDIHSYLNGTFLNLFDAGIKSAIKQVKIPYTKGTGASGTVASGTSGLSTKVFLMSGTEINIRTGSATPVISQGTVLDYFDGAADSYRVAYLNGTAVNWWTRTPGDNTSNAALGLNGSGYGGSHTVTKSYGARPCIIMPSDATVDGDYNVIPPPLTLGSMSIGDTVYMKVNGISKEFIVVNQGRPSTAYDTSCDGTWLLMKDCYAKREWNNDSTNNAYAESTIHSYLNNTFLNLLNATIKNVVKTVKIPYTNGSGADTSVASGTKGLSTRAFLLSYTEVGYSGSSKINVEGAVLAYFNGATNSKRKSTLNGTAVPWWLRSPYKSYAYNACFVGTDGSGPLNANVTSVDSNISIRPCIILPSTLGVDDSYNVTP